MHKKEKKQGRFRLLALSLAVGTMFGSALSASAAYDYRQPTVPDRTVARYSEVPLKRSVDGGKRIDVGARLIDSTTYVPLRAFAELMAKEMGDTSLKISFDEKTRSATVKTNELSMRVTDGSYYVVANGRYLYHSHPAVILNDNRLYLPVRLLEKVYGVQIRWENSTRSITLLGDAKILESGYTYYNENDLYWLSRIISAESRGEPLLGQIAVGNVVLNRVRSASYPNSIYNVIFDFRYGTQFTPAKTGAIYKTPADVSVIAAKICLDGFTVSDKALYFYEPTIATTHWIDRNCQYLFTIGAHWFYR